MEEMRERLRREKEKEEMRERWQKEESERTLEERREAWRRELKNPGQMFKYWI